MNRFFKFMNIIYIHINIYIYIYLNKFNFLIRDKVLHENALCLIVITTM